MNLNEELRFEISRTINTLRLRFANTADPAEHKAILAGIADLNGKLSLLNQASLLQAADVLADATQAVIGVIAAARTGPFDGYLAAIEAHLNRLYTLSGEMNAFEALPPAGDAEEGGEEGGEEMAEAGEGRTQARSLSRGATRSRAPATGLRAPIASKLFDDLKDEYQAWFDACKVRPGQEGVVAYYVKKLKQGQAIYQQVGEDLNGIPWYFIGAIHGMECGFNFNGHLHNGDPLGARTVQVPAGRPVAGAPPFTWRQSARDALTMKGFHQVGDWGVPRMLYLLERYNGMGYRMRRVASPYLWSLSNLYSKGKYVADGSYDPNAVSKQCGVALMIQAAMPAGRRSMMRRRGRGG